MRIILLFTAILMFSGASAYKAEAGLNDTISDNITPSSDYIIEIQVNQNRLSRLEVRDYLKEQQLEILKKFDKFYQLRNEMNEIVDPDNIKKPPKMIVDRPKYERLLKEQMQIKQEVIDLYYMMEKQVYRWEDLTLINEHVRTRAEQDMHYFRKFLLLLLEADQKYINSFEKMLLFFETDFQSYYLIDGTLHFIREESLRYFELIQDELEDSNDDQEHYIFVLKETVRGK